MIQQTLTFPSASKNIDPVTSYRAEEKITKSGKRKTQAMQILEALKQYPRHTSAELAEKTIFNRYQVARRLPDLLHNNLVRQRESRICRVTGSESITWEAV